MAVRITVLLCVILVVYSLWGRAWSRRWFICSGEFFHLVNPPEGEFSVNGPYIFNFPKELPASAENTRYYYYKGLLDKKFGISFTLDAEEYQDMKESYLKFFKEQEAEMSNNWYEFDEKATPEFLEDEELDDLNHLFHGSEDSCTVLAYGIWPGLNTSYYIGGVICNDDRNEMVIFYFFDAGRKEKRDTNYEWGTEAA